MKMRMRAAPARPALAVGDRIALLPHCPIDFEGVGPLPGMEGEIVNLPAVHDFRRCVGVRFDGLAYEWLIPSACLKRGPPVARVQGD
ncbi:MAG: hypothetical protein OXC08_00860 [Thiotrichales bacterium]|nr:hypothetical protein [Thiotrichales bacterium]